MSKKKFTEGLDDLFNDMPEFDSVRGGVDTMLRVESGTLRKNTGKSFAGDLDSMLQDAFNESMRQQDQQPSEALAGKHKSREAAHLAPYHGLDALIRQTIDIKEITQDEESGKKRLTVAVDKTKLEKLKAIAKLENSFMKDLLVELIDEFIDDYRRKKGIDI